MSQKQREFVLETDGLEPVKLEQLDAYIESIDAQEGDLIHVLHRAQEVFGYLPANLQLYIARVLNLSGAKVNGVVSFYSFFTQKPRGKHTISVCMGTACFVRGAQAVLDKAMDMLGISKNEMTEDGLFTIRDIRCVGACGLAPVMMIDEEVYGKLDRKRIEEILATYK